MRGGMGVGLKRANTPFGVPSCSDGLSHGLRKCPLDTFLPSLRSGRPFESLPAESQRADALVGQGFSVSIYIPYGMHLGTEGLSHGLKNSPLDCFSPSLRSGRAFESLPIYQKRGRRQASSFLGGVVIMDTSDGGNLTNAPILRNLHPKVPGCTLAQIFAPCTDKVHPKER